MTTLFTIGFTEKSAQHFFELLETNRVREVVDTRVSSASQLSGFAKERDLEFFLQHIGDIKYEHNLQFAPTKELLGQYRKKEISWEAYATQYKRLIEGRDIKSKYGLNYLDRSCLLCSEHLPQKCHRSILAEYLRELYPELQIVHLT